MRTVEDVTLYANFAIYSTNFIAFPISLKKYLYSVTKFYNVADTYYKLRIKLQMVHHYKTILIHERERKKIFATGRRN
jgi:hypothetical protein